MKTVSPLSRFALVGLACLLAIVGRPGLRAADAAAPGVIDVKVSGTNGTPVILIPGLGTPASIWDDTVADLKKDHVCYAVNLAGFGGLPPVTKREHFLVDVREAVIAYAREHKIDHPVVIGHSLGGVVALDIAAKAPELPGRVIVVDSLPFLAALMIPGVKTEADAARIAPMVSQTLGLANQEQFAAGQKQFIDGMVTSPEKAAAIAAQTGKSDPATVGQAMSELLVVDHRPDLPAIRCPVLVLGALADKMDRGDSREQVEQNYRTQFANLSQAKFQFFPAAKHFIMVDDPVGFEAAIQQQLHESK